MTIQPTASCVKLQLRFTISTAPPPCQCLCHPAQISHTSDSQLLAPLAFYFVCRALLLLLVVTSESGPLGSLELFEGSDVIGAPGTLPSPHVMPIIAPTSLAVALGLAPRRPPPPPPPACPVCFYGTYATSVRTLRAGISLQSC